ncbi:MAG: hypothetical protein HY336_00235 [Candidatus Doudnabacteria bacterium]|nr:hypothetical protein [Candidatus Doudnabacteria bacterium]
MINTNRVLKVTAAWISIVYAVCFLGVALLPGMRPGFMRYGLHMMDNFGPNVINFGTFVSGLIIWNIVAVLAVWLFAALYNSIKK